MKYNIALTLEENVKWLFRKCTDANNGSIHAREDIATTNTNLLEAEANMVEAVIDEYNAIVGEEEE